MIYADQTNHLAVENYGSQKVELMFFSEPTELTVTWSGISRSACWDTLKRGLHEPCTICPRQKAVRGSWACVTCQARHMFSLLWMHANSTLCNDCQVWVPLIQFTLSITHHAYFMSPIKNAPRWLVKGRWEWRLGLFKDPSQLFKTKFDSENGGGLISHGEVFKGLSTKCNVRYSDETSRIIGEKKKKTWWLVVDSAWQAVIPRVGM